MAKTVIGVMGPGNNARKEDLENARKLGALIADRGWVLLTGGRNVGVMHAAARGAHEAGGLTLGILPFEQDLGTSEYVDIPVYTGIGNARNNINVLSSNVVVACGVGLGTVSEITLALKNGKPVVMLNPASALTTLLQELSPSKLSIASSPSEAIRIVEELV